MLKGFGLLVNDFRQQEIKRLRKIGLSQLCKCGCGGFTNEGKQYITGHNNFTSEARKRSSQNLKKLWNDLSYRKEATERARQNLGKVIWNDPSHRKRVKERKENSPIRKRIRESADDIVRLYTVELWTLRRIAKRFNIHHTYIREILFKNNVEIINSNRNREPTSEEARKNLREGHAKRDLSSYRRGFKQPDESVYKTMAKTIRFDIEVGWLIQFKDRKKFAKLNYCAHRERDYGKFTTGKFKEYIEKFYFDPQFNAVYDLWMDSGKNKFLTPSLDHINPKVNGGNNDLNNLRFITMLENRMKSDMNLDEWEVLKKRILNKEIFV